MQEVLNVHFNFRGKPYSAAIIISLRDDLKIIFCQLQNDHLIKEFGDEIDFQTDLVNVLQTHVHHKGLYEIQTCILEEVKKEADFLLQKSFLKK